jgi:anti-sigma B factor antagonist
MAPLENNPNPARRGARGTAAIERLAGGVSLVVMQGEHDIGTQPELTRALERATEQPGQSSVVVDLTRCDFIDSTVIAALIKAAQTQQTRGERLVLVIPSETRMVYRATQVSGIAAVLPIFESRAAALDAIAPPS